MGDRKGLGVVVWWFGGLSQDTDIYICCWWWSQPFGLFLHKGEASIQWRRLHPAHIAYSRRSLLRSPVAQSTQQGPQQQHDAAGLPCLQGHGQPQARALSTAHRITASHRILFLVLDVRCPLPLPVPSCFIFRNTCTALLLDQIFFWRQADIGSIFPSPLTNTLIQPVTSANQPRDASDSSVESKGSCVRMKMCLIIINKSISCFSPCLILKSYITLPDTTLWQRSVTFHPRSFFHLARTTLETSPAACRRFFLFPSIRLFFLYPRLHESFAACISNSTQEKKHIQRTRSLGCSENSRPIIFPKQERIWADLRSLSWIDHTEHTYLIPGSWILEKLHHTE